jgi:hypothetical protein
MGIFQEYFLSFLSSNVPLRFAQISIYIPGTNFSLKPNVTSVSPKRPYPWTAWCYYRSYYRVIGFKNLNPVSFTTVRSFHSFQFVSKASNTGSSWDARAEYSTQKTLKLKTKSVALVRERTIPTEWPPLVGIMPTFADRRRRMVSAMDPHACILALLSSSE